MASERLVATLPEEPVSLVMFNFGFAGEGLSVIYGRDDVRTSRWHAYSVEIVSRNIIGSCCLQLDEGGAAQMD